MMKTFFNVVINIVVLPALLVLCLIGFCVMATTDVVDKIMKL